jgi:antitoxin (DNA-binding transcriptional repressor) of toxin-antitoxin stability system
MTRDGKTITVDACEAQAEIISLLAEVESHGQTVRIVRDGKVVAELRPGGSPLPDLPYIANLAGRQLAANAFDETSQDEWPNESR